MGDSCKVSFLMDCPKLARIERFAHLHAMSVSEAFRFVIDAGLETLAKANMLEAVPLGHGATRGRMPAPERRSQDGDPS